MGNVESFLKPGALLHRSRGPLLYHFGNNSDHVFAVTLFLENPGYVVLHDASLNYLATLVDAADRPFAFQDTMSALGEGWVPGPDQRLRLFVFDVLALGDDRLVEMDDINGEMPQTDVALVIGVLLLIPFLMFHAEPRATTTT